LVARYFDGKIRYAIHFFEVNKKISPKHAFDFVAVKILLVFCAVEL
jgi:hypothetical protein